MATVTIMKYCLSLVMLLAALSSFQAWHGNAIGFEVGKAGYVQSVALDFKLGLPSGSRNRDLRVSSPALWQTPAVTHTDRLSKVDAAQ